MFIKNIKGGGAPPALQRVLTAGAFALTGLIATVVGIEGGNAILTTLNLLENVAGAGSVSLMFFLKVSPKNNNKNKLK